MRLQQRARVCLRASALVTISLLCCMAASATTVETLFTTQVPQGLNFSDGSTSNYELGMKFTADVAGHITAVRFWKSSGESGTHVGHIWSASGRLLASVTFVNETSSGWQQQALVSPLGVAANTVYVVSVNTGNTFYVCTNYGFATQIVHQDLRSVVGGDGVFGPPDRFPTSSYKSNNYFRDVVFTPQPSGLSSSSANLNFGNVNVGSNATQTLTLTNNAASSVTISQVSASGTGFSATGINVPLVLAPAQQASLTVSFAPASMGTLTGKVAVTSTASNPTMSVSLQGVGLQPQITLVPASISFGSAATGSANTQTVTLSDSGNANLTVSQAVAAGAGFSLTGPALPLTLTPGHSTAFTARFAPAAAGSVSGGLSFASNAPGSPTAVPLTGTGVTQSLLLSLAPTSIAFGNIAMGSSSKQFVTLTNSGNSPISVSGLSAAGAYFSVSGVTLPVTLSPAQSASFSAVFSPAAAGSFTGSVSVVSTAGNSPAIVSLSGSGVQAATHMATLNWTASTSSVMGYNVYRGSTTGGPYTKITSSPVSATTFSDANVQAGLTYYYVVTSVDSSGMESADSPEVSATIP